VISAPFLVFGGLIGLVVGSYVTTAALRATRHEPSSWGRSHCDACGTPLNFLQTTPLLSFLALKGACRTCGGPIDRIHLVGEIAGGVIGAVATLAPPGVETLLVCALGFVLLAAAVVDARTRRLPNVLTAAVALICLTLSARAGVASLAVGLVAASLAFLLLMGLRRFRAAAGRDPGLGFGDVKLICALACWLGAYTAWMLALAAVLGLLSVAIRPPLDGRIAFGPMIAAASLGIAFGMEGGWWPAVI